jgi:NAD(P)H-nitrite reductase large subunit
VNHVLIGAGPAAIAAMETIREVGRPDDTITLISDEPAYSRMVLPYWAAGEIPREHIFIASPDTFARARVQTMFGRRVMRVLPGERVVVTDDGKRIGYDRLLIATGSSPARVPVPGSDLPGVLSFWTADDCSRALAAIDRGRRVVLVGAGFIGLIVLNALAKRGLALTVVEVAPHVLPRMLDATGAGMVASWLKARGVAVECPAQVAGIGMASDGTLGVELDSGRTLPADLVIMATGIRPNVGFLADSGVAIGPGQGVLVDDRLAASVPGVHAAGDVAEGPVLGGAGGRAVHAIQPTAIEQGRVAGANMAGQEIRYRGSLLINVLDVCSLQCASFGDWAGAGREATTVANPRRPIYRKLVWDGDRLVGASFVGPKPDVTLLNDLGMVKGLIQLGIPFGVVKRHLVERPFEIRKAYIQLGAAARLYPSTLLARPATDRPYRFAGARPPTGPAGPHADLASTRPEALAAAAPTPTPGIFKPKA